MSAKAAGEAGERPTLKSPGNIAAGLQTQSFPYEPRDNLPDEIQ